MRYSSDGYNQQISDESLFNFPQYHSANLRATGPWLPSIFKDVRYDAGVGFRETDGRQTRYTTDLGLSSRFKGLLFNNEISYQHDTVGINTSTLDNDRLRGSSSVRGMAFGTRWRNTLSYEVLPDFELRNYHLNLNKRFSNTLSTDADLRHNFLRNLTEASVSGSYQHAKATVSPSLSVDSDSNILAKVDVRFGVAQDPATKDLVMKGASISTRGAISAFTYLDKNADGIFNGDDEPLPDVHVRATQLNRFGISNESGNIFLYDLQTNVISDIVMEENSTFDPTWIAGFPGISAKPRAGDTIHVDFPVLRGAEIDGTAYVENSGGIRQPARNVILQLVTPSGKIAQETETPFDGFFILSRIRPGIYYLNADTKNSPIRGFMLPRKVTITPEGAILYGKDLTIYRGPEMKFHFSSTTESPAEKRRTKILHAEDIAQQDVFIRLGEFKSQLAMTVAWYKFRLKTRSWDKKMTLVKKMDDIQADPKTGLMPLLLAADTPLRIEEAATICETLIEDGFRCGVDIITTYRQSLPTSAQEVQQKPTESAI